MDRVQSTFIEGRAFQDNVLVAFKILHGMKNKKNGTVGDMSLKDRYKQSVR